MKMIKIIIEIKNKHNTDSIYKSYLFQRVKIEQLEITYIIILEKISVISSGEYFGRLVKHTKSQLRIPLEESSEG